MTTAKNPSPPGEEGGTSRKPIESVIEENVLEKISILLKRVERKADDFKNYHAKIEELTASLHAKINGANSVEQADSSWRPIGADDDGDDRTTTKVPTSDDPYSFKLPRDVYSILATASLGSYPFWISMLVIFGFQYSLLILLLANQVDIDSGDNPLNLPANVEAPVRISQVLLVAIALFSQEDLLIGIESLSDGFPNMFQGHGRFQNITFVQWKTTSFIRLVQGFLNLFAAFVLSIQAETIPDILLDVLGVGFISNLDNLAFGLSLKGYFGSSMKALAQDVCDVIFHRDTNTKKHKNASAKPIPEVKSSMHKMTVFAVFMWMLAAFTMFSIQQDKGRYSDQDIHIEFGDEVLPFLGLFNGCYKASKSSEHFAGRLIYEQVGYPNGGKFGFCSDFGEGHGGWTFFIGENRQDICGKYITRSGETTTFSLLEAAETKWYTSDDLPLDYLEITEIKTPNSECGQSMFKESSDTCPTILGLDSLPMSRLPLRYSDKAGSLSGLDASVSHPIYYHNLTEVGSFDLIFFTGRRWVRTKSAHIASLAAKETSLSDIQDFFFVNHGLSILIDGLRTSLENRELVTAISEVVDSSRDQGSPLGLQWYFPRYDTTEDKNKGDSRKHLQRNVPTADLARPIDSVLICLHCNDETNPCRYEGVCNSHSGICDCKHGAEGKLCQTRPHANGVCNLYFNTAEHQYDGGDCCGGTCEGAKCGDDDLPDPFLAATQSDSWLQWYDFFNVTEDWRDAFRGREFAFGVDVVNDDDLGFYFVPFRYEHCIDREAALLSIKVEPFFNEGYLEFQGIFVRCDGTLYLRLPHFYIRSDSPGKTFTEKVRVPYGAQCDIEFDWHHHPYLEVSILAENQKVPFVQQRRPHTNPLMSPVSMSFLIPESRCVWNAFVENRLSVLTVWETDVNMPALSLGWNEYMLEEDYARFAEGGQLDTVCSRDQDEVVDRFSLWTISELLDDDPENFVGHVCDGLWNYGLSMSCSGRRVNELELYVDANIDHSNIAEVIKLSTYVKKLEFFELNVGGLAALPTAIGLLSALPSLTTLVFSNGRFSSLPSEIGSLTSLQHLYLSNNELTSLPSEFASLTSLEGLDLTRNRFTFMPREICSLTSLWWLDFSFNQLTSLPPEIGNLTSLEDLDLYSNNLTSLPAEMGSLEALTELDLRFNSLTADSLPKEIESLVSLNVSLCGEDDSCDCKDFPGWRDALGTVCFYYEVDDICEKADQYANEDGVSAKDACCHCGGGNPV